MNIYDTDISKRVLHRFIIEIQLLLVENLKKLDVSIRMNCRHRDKLDEQTKNSGTGDKHINNLSQEEEPYSGMKRTHVEGCTVTYCG